MSMGFNSQSLKNKKSGAPMTPESFADSLAFGDEVKALALLRSSALKMQRESIPPVSAESFD